jgi:uncharacterized protein
MSAPATPLEVLGRRRELLLARDMEAFADLFAADGVIELPFGGPGLPDRLEGREEIRAFSLKADPSGLEISDLRIRDVHQSTDPEVVIMELTTVGRVVATGEPFEVPCIQVFRIRDGRIVLFRDYVGAGSLPAAA